VFERARRPDAWQIFEYQDSYANERAVVLHARECRKPADISSVAVTARRSATYISSVCRSVVFEVSKTYSVLRRVIVHHASPDGFARSTSKMAARARRSSQNHTLFPQNIAARPLRLPWVWIKPGRSHDLGCRGRVGDRRTCVDEGPAQPEGREPVTSVEGLPAGAPTVRRRVSPGTARGPQGPARDTCRSRRATGAGGAP
jgi:hypothetical protein